MTDGIRKNDYGGYLTEYKKDIPLLITQSLGKDDAELFRQYRLQWDAAEGHDVKYPFPLTLNFELQDRCNLTCAHCVRHIKGYRVSSSGSPRLGLKLFKKIIDEGSEYGLPSITLGGSGEGLLEKDLVKMIEYARDKGVLDIWLSTNGQLLTKDIARELIRVKLTRISISIDAFSEETYRKVRGADYRRLMANIDFLMEEKIRQGATLPIIRVTCIKLQDNIEERVSFIDYWCRRVETVGLQEFLDFQTEKNLKAEEVEPFSCTYPWRSLMIWANGDVSPCCTFHGKLHALGNVHDSSLKEIWDSKKMANLRRNLINRRYPKACIECLGTPKEKKNEVAQ